MEMTIMSDVIEDYLVETQVIHYRNPVIQEKVAEMKRLGIRKET
ncbi:hypothetical protein [Oceanobacillus halotolerans]|nr:hypothetical protein [Oceanobacillus halotolerans]